MKEFDQMGKLVHMYCNKCGRMLRVKDGMLMDGVYEGKYHFGYFSGKDGQTQEFDLCETCYDEMIAEFAIPVCIKEEFEWQA